MFATKTRETLSFSDDAMGATASEFNAFEDRTGTVKDKDGTDSKVKHADDAMKEGDDVWF